MHVVKVVRRGYLGCQEAGNHHGLLHACGKFLGTLIFMLPTRVCVGNQCPVEDQLLQTMSNQDWMKLEDSNIPKFNTKNLSNYFIDRTALDGRPANDSKNVNSHAYPLFMAGHIQSIYTKIQDSLCLIKCTCLLEIKKDRLYKINVALDSSGDVTQASCDCPAGVGPYGSCKHIAALCYALEGFTKLRSLLSVTIS